MRKLLVLGVTFLAGCTPLGELSVEQRRLDFGPAIPGIVWKKRTFVHSEHGASLTLKGSSSNPAFEVSFPEGPSLPANGMRELEVSYRPTPLIAQREEGTITLTTTTVKELSATLDVSGLPTEVDCSVPQSLDFGTVQRGDTARLTLELANESSYWAIAVVNGTTNPFFSVAPERVGLGSGETHTVTVSFMPNTDALYMGTLGVKRHEELCEEHLITLTGKGTEGRFSWAPSTLDFGDVPVGTTARLTLTFTNLDFFPVTLSRLELREGSVPSGVFAAPGPSLVLPAATRDAAGELVPGVASLEVSFTPSAAGPRVAQLVASVSGLTIQHSMSVNLRGAGVP